jgi:hypothetical protein
MNCLAGKSRRIIIGEALTTNTMLDDLGESDIFKISNEKESCTQGIDLSTKWMTLKQFTSIDGADKRDGTTAIGFIDAEGQGDRDITYDARLVCPILLASKSVIFNWYVLLETLLR